MEKDVIIVGGGFAGLAAATYLVRARRTVTVIDTGAPRNRFAHASHGFLGQDGRPPRKILAAAREQLLAYPTAEIAHGEAVDAGRDEDGFTVRLADDRELTARKLILAFGLRDELPDIPGLAERWGTSVLHCPYCHGFEFADRPLGVLYRTPMSVHQAGLILQWGPVTLFLDGAALAPEDAATLDKHNMQVEPGPIAALEGDGDALRAVRLRIGEQRRIEALYITPRSVLSSPLAAQLGAEIQTGPLGEMIVTDQEKRTRVPGLFAAGDIARVPHSVSWAVADGVTAGVCTHRSLIFG